MENKPAAPVNETEETLPSLPLPPTTDGLEEEKGWSKNRGKDFGSAFLEKVSKASIGQLREMVNAGTGDSQPPHVPFNVESHKVNPCNDVIQITVMDAPGSGGAHHKYAIMWPVVNNSLLNQTGMSYQGGVINFQYGPIKEVGTNGFTHEVLLAIVAHRLECFQAGPYACEENANALAHVLDALRILKERTRNHLARGVEGTHQK